MYHFCVDRDTCNTGLSDFEKKEKEEKLIFQLLGTGWLVNEQFHFAGLPIGI